MLSFSEAQIIQYITDFFWPFLRIGGLMLVAPVLNTRQMPARFKVLLSVLITLVLVPTLPSAPQLPLFGAESLLMASQQVLIGVAMGFILQLAFSALVFGGQIMAYSMGLGFALMMDPQNGVQVPMVSQFWLILATLSFLLANGHLMLFEALAQSFAVVPVAVDGLTRAGFWAIAGWGSRMFAAGVVMALPVLTALLLVNVGLGVVSRAAPQLNILAIGFPITLMMGMVLMWLTLPQVLNGFSSLVREALDHAGAVLVLR